MYNWFLHFITASNFLNYPKSKSLRGLCVIINNIKFKGQENYRRGAEIDQTRIVELFRGLDFTVEEHKNQSQHQMDDVFDDASQKTDHKHYDMFVGVVMSHGGEQDKICGSDGNSTTVQRLMKAFLPSNCPSLLGKPKLFFFQCCRGPGEQTKVSPAGESTAFDWDADSTLSSTPFPHEADFLLAFSTPPGYKAYRKPKSGSIYIRALVDVIKEYHSTTHLLDMLTEVNRKVAEEGFKQIPAPTHTLRGKVFL